jgi:hypothetical protein
MAVFQNTRYVEFYQKEESRGLQHILFLKGPVVCHQGRKKDWMNPVTNFPGLPKFLDWVQMW